VGDKAVQSDCCLQSLVAGARNLLSNELQTDGIGRSARGGDRKHVKRICCDTEYDQEETVNRQTDSESPALKLLRRRTSYLL
jgi:hypothetical protein